MTGAAGFRFPFGLRIRRSRLLTAIVSSAHLIVALIVGSDGIPWFLQWGIYLLLGVSWLAYLREPLPTDLRLFADGSFELVFAASDVVKASIVADSVVMPWLVIIRARWGTDRLRSLVLLPDTTDHDSYRQLRVWLKWRAAIRSPD